MLLNVHAVELRATFVWARLRLGCCGPYGGLHAGRNRGFCTTRSPLAACRRRVGPSCSAIPPVLALLHQFRMQFPLAILFVCFGSHRQVTPVLELHATLWSQHVRIAVFAVSCIWNLRVLDRKLSSG